MAQIKCLLLGEDYWFRYAWHYQYSFLFFAYLLCSLLLHYGRFLML